MKDGKLESNERWQECVEWMRRQRTEGHTYRQIAAEAAQNFNTTLDHTTVYRILNGKRELDGARLQPAQPSQPPSSSRPRGMKTEPPSEKKFKTWPMNETQKSTTVRSKKR
jgi:hypothetical protein